MNQRLAYIDVAKGLAMILMILCHSGMHNGFTQWIYAFHMPLFFIVSGFLYNGEHTELGPYIKKKFYQLIVPFILFSLMLCFGSRGGEDWIYILYGSRDSLAFAKTFTPLWFLPCFFFSSFLFRLISNISNYNVVRLCVLIICIPGFIGGYYHKFFKYGFPFNIDVALVGVLLMGIGKELKIIYEKSFFSNIGVGVFCLLIGSIVAFLNRPESLTVGNPHVEMSIGAYGNPILFIISATLLVYAIIQFCKMIPQSFLSNGIEFIGKNSMSFLCLHGFTNMLLIGALRYIHLSMPLIVCIINIVLCTFATMIINKNCPNIIGKK